MAVRIRTRHFFLKLLLVFVCLAAGAAGGTAFAAPPTSAYTPGETLDPSCAPGSTNCTVDSSTAAYFTATSTTATSTFGGGFQSKFIAVTTGTATSTISANSTSTLTSGLSVSAGGLKVSSLVSCDTIDTDANGNFVCGTDSVGGGGSEVNWTFFNSSGIRVSTTTNQVLIGATATTSLAKLEVRGDTYISGNLGIGTTSPYAKLSVVGPVVAEYLHATSTTATSTIGGVLSIGSTTPASSSLFSVGTSSPLFVISNNSAANVGIGRVPVVFSVAALTVGSAGIRDAGSGVLTVFRSSDGTSGTFSAGAITSGSYTTNSTGQPTKLGISSISDTSQTEAVLLASGTNSQTSSPSPFAAVLIKPTYSQTSGTAANTDLYILRNETAIGSGSQNLFEAAVGGSLNSFATSTKMVLTRSGNLGIGTTSPYAKLSVVGEIVGAYFTGTTTATSTLGGGLQATALNLTGSATSTAANGINLSAGCFAVSGTCLGGGGGSGTVNTGAANTLAYYPSGGTTVDDAAALFYDSTNSRLGIGTSSPYAKLSVVGEIVSSFFTATSTTATSTIAGGLTVSGGGLKVSTIPSCDSVDTDANGNFVCGTDAGGSGSPNGSSGAVQFTNGSSFVGDASNFFWDNTNKKLGIGTTTPWARFSVAGVASQGLGPLLTVSSSTASATTTVFHIAHTGFVGIGTTSPYARLSVVGEVVGEKFSATSTTATSSFAGGVDIQSGAFTHDFSSGVTSIDNLEIGAFFFDTNAGVVSWADMPVTSNASAGTVQSYSAQIDGFSLLTIYSESDGAGGVKNQGIGIGTTSATARLTVTATSSSSNLPIFNIVAVPSSGGTTTALTVASTGFLGLGTTSPYARLSVVGETVAQYFTATSTNSTSTFSGGVSAGLLTVSSTTATSTFANGIALSGGCFRLASGACLTPGAASAAGSTGAVQFNSGGVLGADDTNFVWNNTTKRLTLSVLDISTTTATTTIAGGLAVETSGFVYDFSTNKVGIGTAAPVQKLDVTGTSVSGGSAQTNISAFGGSGIRINGSLASDGQDGLMYQSGAGGGAGIVFRRGGSFDTYIDFYTNNAGTAGAITRQMTLLNTGEFGVGTSSPWRKFSVTGTVAFSGLSAAVGDNLLCLDAATFEVTTAANCTTSSRRFKHDIEDLDTGLAEIRKLRPTSFRLNKNNVEHIGLIAEEVNEVEPRIIFYDEDGVTPRGIRYEEFTALLTKGIQELASTTDDFEMRIAALEAVSSTSTPNMLERVSGWLADLGVNIRDSLVSIVDLAVENLVVGSPEKPSGITLFDKETGEPYCLEIIDGEPESTPGECEGIEDKPWNEYVADEDEDDGGSGGSESDGTDSGPEQTEEAGEEPPSEPVGETPADSDEGGEPEPPTSDVEGAQTPDAGDEEPAPPEEPEPAPEEAPADNEPAPTE